MNMYDDFDKRFLVFSSETLSILEAYLTSDEIIYRGETIASVELVNGEVILTFKSKGSNEALNYINKILEQINSDSIIRKVVNEWYLIKRN